MQNAANHAVRSRRCSPVSDEDAGRFWRRRFARRLAILAAFGGACVGCGGPPATDFDRLYAERPNVRAADRSVLAGRRILIDPGHGGRFGGTTGADSTREADVNLGVALYLWGLLHDAGAEVSLTRASDRDLLPTGEAALAADLRQRVARLDSLQPDVFLSLHHNSNAELDRERNAVETYYKLGDAGASYDLARAIHARLARGLGIERAEIRPGNYFVLRHASTAAVLGEASYLSHPGVESKLRLAEKQLLEAEAYYLGLIDYFSRGVPRVRRLDARGDTLRAGDELVFEIRDDGGGIDPASVRVSWNGRTLPAAFDATRHTLALRIDPSLPAGAHDVLVEARNVAGQASVPVRQRVVVFAEPHAIELVQEPRPAALGGEARLTVHVRDAWSRSVAHGIPVTLTPRGCDIDVQEATTQDGTILARAHLRDASASVQVACGSVRRTFEVAIDAAATPQRFAHIVDARHGTPLADATAQSGAGARPSDRAGLMPIAAGAAELRIERTGYVPFRGGVPTAGDVALQPLHAGALHGLTFVLDPGGDPRAPTQPQSGVSEAQVAFDVVRVLSQLLEGAGARSVTTRGVSEALPVSERARLALEAQASWYVQIETPLDAAAGAQVVHYTQSADGAKLAAAMARWVQRRLGAAATVVHDTRPVLQQTPCPAVVARLPGLAGATHAAVRERAYAVFMGLLTAIAPSLETQPPLAGRLVAPPGTALPALVVLDGAASLGLAADATFRFECVAAGAHVLALVGRDTRHEFVVTAGNDSTFVELRIPADTP